MKKKEKHTLMQRKPKELEELVAKKRSEIANAYLRRSDEKNTNLIKTMKQELAIILTALKIHNNE